MNAPANGMSPQQANAVARTLITNNAVIRHQSIYNRTVDPATEPVINIQPRYAGLILGFIVNIRSTVTVPASTGTALTRTQFGPLNLVNEVRLDDLNNNTRIQTSGWHLGMLNSARSGDPYLVTRTNTNYPVGVGKTFTSLMEGAATIAQDANSDVAATYYVPCAYSEKDLRGAIFANVVNATMQLQLSLNQAVASARTLSAGSDAVYVTADASTTPVATIGDFEIEVIQVYYDKLPQGDAGYVLPLLDLGTVYEIKRTQDTGLVQGQDFQISYSNFRDFLSTFVLYRNRVSPTAAFATEADINHWALETANFTQIYKLAPRYIGKWARQTIENDFPLGLYYFPTREKPISTNNFGNMQLVLNPANVQTNAAALIGFEAFALTSRIGQAASLNVG